MPNWLKYPLTLLAVASVSALLLAGLEVLTRPQKAKLAKEESAKARKLVLPLATAFKKKGNCEVGYDNSNSVVGYIAKGQAVGYSSTIKVMVGTDKKIDVQGVKVLYQKETPGLGDKVIEIKSTKTWGTVLSGEKTPKGKPWFTEQFVGKVPPFKVKKDGGKIDAITGATISSRAVCKAVNQAIDSIKECSK